MAILTDERLIGMIKSGVMGIDPFDEGNLQPTSYDLGVGPRAIEQGHETKAPRGGITIRPRRFVLLSTREYIRLPKDAIAKIFLRSSLAREGLFPEGQGRVEAGFEGVLTLPVVNLGPKPIHLGIGERVATIEFYALSELPRTTYSGKYQGSRGPMASYRKEKSVT